MFIDAHHLYQQVSRAHREFTPGQLEFLANTVRCYRGEAPENQHNSADFFASKFPDTEYIDVPGLCKIATIAEIESQGWNLNPGRYVEVDEQTTDDFDFEIPLPPLPTQRKIAAVLSAYDDLIENNTRRIKILEDMAQTLYQEWFVHFRFPGHENVPIIESPLGPIPQG